MNSTESNPNIQVDLDKQQINDRLAILKSSFKSKSTV